jgi:hypothetical protein
MPFLSYVSVPLPPIVLLILAAVFGLFAATFVPHRRARYRRRLEDAYSRFESNGPAPTPKPRLERRETIRRLLPALNPTYHRK